MRWRTKNDKYEVCPFLGHCYNLQSMVAQSPISLTSDHVDNVNHLLWASTEGETVQKLFFGSVSKKKLPQNYFHHSEVIFTAKEGLWGSKGYFCLSLALLGV